MCNHRASRDCRANRGKMAHGKAATGKVTTFVGPVWIKALIKGQCFFGRQPKVNCGDSLPPYVN